MISVNDKWKEGRVVVDEAVEMSVTDEFKTVDLILSSSAKTRGVDAFALALIKSEKQARRLITYLVYQHSWCDQDTIPSLRAALEKSKKVYFDGLLNGWDAIHPTPVRKLVGKEYKRLKTRLSEAAKYRNKIFHGQLTDRNLKRRELLTFVDDIRAWCEALGNGAQCEVGYDGCGRKSFRKASNAVKLCERYRTTFKNLACYEQFIKLSMERS